MSVTGKEAACCCLPAPDSLLPLKNRTLFQISIMGCLQFHRATRPIRTVARSGCHLLLLLVLKRASSRAAGVRGLKVRSSIPTRAAASAAWRGRLLPIPLRPILRAAAPPEEPRDRNNVLREIGGSCVPAARFAAERFV